MTCKDMIRSKIKSILKTGLLASKRIIIKNKTFRKVGLRIKRVLFDESTPIIYNYSRYAPSIMEYKKQIIEAESFNLKPLISIIMPTYNTPPKYLKECIESVLVQSYKNWELCIADDASSNKEVVKIIEEFANEDKRIKYIIRKKNGHISKATNTAMKIASGEFIGLLDHDDILWPNALFEVVKSINNNPKIDLLYTDEDKINSNNEIHSYPFFKPSWSPEFLESCNYITHFSVIRRTIVDEIGGMRVGYEGAQDWDLFIRITERTDNITHIPKVLYSWRIHENSTAKSTNAKPYVYESQRKLLSDHVSRIKEEALVKRGIIKEHSIIEYLPHKSSKISIIIAGDRDARIKSSLKSVLKTNNYKNTDIYAVSSIKREYNKCKRIANKNKNCKVIFNDENLCLAQKFNSIAQRCDGEYLLFVEAGLAITTSKWAEYLLGDSQRPDVGIVGGRIIGFNKTKFLRAGCAAGIYGLYAPLLEGMDLDDVHYMRGLYGQSRRNVSILDGYFIVKRSLYDEVGYFDEELGDLFAADFSLKVLSKKYRNIYNPFVSAIDLLNKTAGDRDRLRNKKITKKFQERWIKYIYNDPYFNPNFTRTNAQLDIK